MDWNGSHLTLPAFVSGPETSLSFLYNYDLHHPAGSQTQQQYGVGMMGKHQENSIEKKKRLTSEQLDSLEMSFQEDIKLDPDRKMLLAQELGLHPRQVAVWFQNRRARWKSKQLERLYYSLKKELDRVSMEKNQLQQEVMVLRAMIHKEEAEKKQVVSAAGYQTDISGGEDTLILDTTSLVAIQTNNYHMPQGTTTSSLVAATSNVNNMCNQHHNNIDEDDEGNYGFHMDDVDYNSVAMAPYYWGANMP